MHAFSFSECKDGVRPEKKSSARDLNILTGL